MGFEWSRVAAAPGAGELEITLMGPGYGESVVVHLGSNVWLVVDSCLDVGDRVPAPLRYLQSLAVSPEDVAMVAATHWDQDHVRGIGDLVAACKNATFLCAKAFTSQEEFLAYIEEISIGGGDRGVSDIRNAFIEVRKSKRVVKAAYPGRVVHRLPNAVAASGHDIKIYSLSPSDKEHDLFLTEIAQQRPRAGDPFRIASGRKPNLASVVLSIDAGNEVILLGADMETHTDADRGWKAVIREGQTVGRGLGGLLKVPHHGSKSGHEEGMWEQMLKPRPLAVIAPFGKGKLQSRPPTEADLVRIAQRASHVYLTAPHVSPRLPPRNAAVARGLREQGIATSNLRRPLGLVRFRRAASGQWRAETFGPARQVA